MNGSLITKSDALAKKARLILKSCRGTDGVFIFNRERGNLRKTGMYRTYSEGCIKV